MIPPETAKVCAYIAAANPKWLATPETIHVYDELLADLKYEHVLDAVKRILLTSDWVPTPAQIRRTVFEVQGCLAPSKGAAWEEVMRKARAGSRNITPTFSHPSISAAVKTFGWYEVCSSINPDTLRSQFWKVYGDLVVEFDRDVILSTSPAIAAPTRRELEG